VPRSGLAHFVRQERSDSTKCDKENIRLKLLLAFFRPDGRSSTSFFFYSAGEPIFNIFSLLHSLQFGRMDDLQHLFLIFGWRADLQYIFFFLLSSIRPHGRSLTSCCMIRPKVWRDIVKVQYQNVRKYT